MVRLWLKAFFAVGLAGAEGAIALPTSGVVPH